MAPFWTVRRPAALPTLLLAVTAAAELALPWRAAGRILGTAAALALAMLLLRRTARQLRAALRVRAALQARLVDVGLAVALLALLASQASVLGQVLADPRQASALDPVYHQYVVAFLIVAGLRLLLGDFSVRRVLHRLDLRPAQTVALGFALMILVGTLLLSLPLSLVHLVELSLLDALFTATSALTTTGLAVYDPGTFLTPFGQLVVLVLMQVGGVGTMAASASLVVLAGRRLRLSTAAALQATMDLDTLGQVRGQVLAVLVLTVAAEASGALALYVLWRGVPGVEHPVFDAIFHAVSAFCTAGLSSFPRGLERFHASAATQVVLVLLTLVGSLGLPVLVSLGQVARTRWTGRAGPGLTLHTRLALLAMAVLVGGSTVLVLALEWAGSLASQGAPARLLGAVFLATSAHSSAGFSTFDLATLAPATVWILLVVMFVGGNPGSTAGGIKTTTAAVVTATLWATVQGRQRVEAFRRTIPDEQVAKALALVGIGAATVIVGVLALLATQSAPPAGLLFEAVSAFGTVGLSTGVTPGLNPAGKVLIMALMFMGRTGPLTLGFALAARRPPARVAYPAEKVMLG